MFHMTVALFAFGIATGGCAPMPSAVTDTAIDATTAVSAAASPSFPDRAHPEVVDAADVVPAAKKYHHIIKTQYDGSIETTVRLCVSATGEVVGVKLVESSGIAEYDRQVVAAVSNWRYQPLYMGAEPRQICELLSVVYNANG